MIDDKQLDLGLGAHPVASEVIPQENDDELDVGQADAAYLARLIDAE